jgi:peroxiredoxin Q/BCP
MSLIPSISLFADPIAIGADAPAMQVRIHTGETIDLADLYAKGPVLVYFYPKSDTPGCTAQACNLRDNFSDLEAASVKIIGVSADAVAKQQAFVEKYTLPFPIVADEDRALGKAFGVGTFMGMVFKRQSFLVVDGKIAWRDLDAKPATQTSDALAALKSLPDA